MNMKYTLRQLYALVLLAAIVLIGFSSCRSKSPTKSVETSTDEIPTKMINIIQNGVSDYVLVYNASDRLDSMMADRIWELLYNTYQVSLPKRSDKDVYDFEIVIGSASRPEIAEMNQSLIGEDDFVIYNKGNKLFLYADSMVGANRMMIAFQERYLTFGEEKILSVPDEVELCGSAYPGEFVGESAILYTHGETDYTIVYNFQNADDERVAYFIKSQISELSGAIPKVSGDSSQASELEIIIGTGAINRREATVAAQRLENENDFILTLSGKKLILMATDAASLLRGAEYLTQKILKKSMNGSCTVRACDEYIYSLDDRSYSIEQDRLAWLYRQVLDRYPTLYSYYYMNMVSSSSREDQMLCEALITRLGNSAVFSIGKTVALYQGMVCKLSVNDASATAERNGSSITIPSDFANRMFDIESDENTMITLEDLADKIGYTVYEAADIGLVMILAPGVASFENDSEIQGGYSNRQYKNRMLIFFENSAMPEPGNNTEQSRVVIEKATDYYPEDALDYQEPVYTNFYSPSILTVERGGKTVIYASNERSRTQNGDELSTVTMLRRSNDGGKTWEDIASVQGVRWGVLFEMNGIVYMVGSNLTNHTVLCRLNEDGTVFVGTLWTGVSAVFEPLIADGILYLPLDSTVASIPVTADPFQAENWIRTQDSKELITRAWFQKASGKTLNGEGTADCLEGNALKGPDGAIYVYYRIESQPNGNYAVLLRLSEDRTMLELLPGYASLVLFPTTISRFVIKYDEISGYYICISNLYTVSRTPRARNVVGLSVSKDMLHWTTVDTLLVDREMMNSECSGWAHAFQYVDWDFDGDDLVMTVRETTGFSNTFHDGKYYTFYRLSGFRDLIDATVESLQREAS